MCCFYEVKTLKVDKAKLVKEPAREINVSAIRAAFALDNCPICHGKGFYLCANCEDGMVAFLGGLQECRDCCGSGVKPCSVCQGRGKFPPNPTSKTRSVKHSGTRTAGILE
ncbi:MAG: hypothetical protein ACE5G1_07045 [bacterium]